MELGTRRELDDLLRRLATGDRAAFRPVFDLMWPVVRRFVRSSLPDWTDAEDVAQDALIKVFARASEFDASREALPWILGVAAWECRTARRRRMRYREATPDAIGDLPGPGSSPEQRVIDDDITAAALEVLGGMPEADRETILAALAGGEARPPVAGATFRKRLSRAFTRLRTAWRARHGVE